MVNSELFKNMVENDSENMETVRPAQFSRIQAKTVQAITLLDTYENLFVRA